MRVCVKELGARSDQAPIHGVTSALEPRFQRLHLRCREVRNKLFGDWLVPNLGQPIRAEKNSHAAPPLYALIPRDGNHRGSGRAVSSRCGLGVVPGRQHREGAEPPAPDGSAEHVREVHVARRDRDRPNTARLS